MAIDTWPDLQYSRWKDTYQTLHMWLQVIGKVALATAPPINHSWGSALRVTPRGLTTGMLNLRSRPFSIAVDFVDHRVTVDIAGGESRALALEPRTVADFYREMMALLHAMRLDVRIWPMPVEIPAPVRFDQDTVHAAYNPAEAEAFWRILVAVEHVFTDTRCSFLGKVSPAHFFWGSCDLAITRFSGREAPPREGPAFMQEAYSHEVISHGFWPGNDTIPEAVFYAYAVPEPAGLKQVTVEPSAAYYHQEMGEFILPYKAVRESASPADTLRAFINSTYDRAATLAKWDRVALERSAPR